MPGGKGRGDGMGCRGGRGSGRGGGKGQGSGRGFGSGGGKGQESGSNSGMGLDDVFRNISRIFPGEDTMGIQPVGEPVKVADSGTVPRTRNATGDRVRQAEDDLSLRVEVNMLKDDIKIIYKILRKIQEKLDSLAPKDENKEEEKKEEEEKEYSTDQ